MTYFESIGVAKQCSAPSVDYAQKSFKKSCTICVHTGKNIPCDRCHIASAHNDVIHILFNIK